MLVPYAKGKLDQLYDDVASQYRNHSRTFTVPNVPASDIDADDPATSTTATSPSAAASSDLPAQLSSQETSPADPNSVGGASPRIISNPNVTTNRPPSPAQRRVQLRAAQIVATIRTLRRSAMWLFVKIYPYLNAAYELSFFVYNLLYLYNQLEYYTPLYHLQHVTVQRMSLREMVSCLAWFTPTFVTCRMLKLRG